VVKYVTILFIMILSTYYIFATNSFGGGQVVYFVI